MSLPKYKYLLTYRYAEIIHDLTVDFCRIYLSDLSNLSHLGHQTEKPILLKDPQDAANFLPTLCHLETYLLDKQIKSLEKRFIDEGGYTENLFKKRLRSKI